MPRAIAVAVVPLAIPAGKVADLPAAHPDIPRLGDHRDVLQGGVVENRLQEGMLGVEVRRRIAPERGHEIEAEPVHLDLARPVAQRVEDEPLHDRPRGVDRVAAAGDIQVLAAAAALAVTGPAPDVPVVARVVDAAEARRRAVHALLGGVVVDDVEHDLEAGLVQQPHHALDLAQHGVRAALLGLARGVRRVRGEEVQGVVAPVVGEAEGLQPLLAHELVDRQQLDRGHAEVLQVRDRRRVGEPRVGAAQLVGQLGRELGESLDVRFVDDALIVRDARLAYAAPVERVPEHAGAPLTVRAALDAARVRVQQQTVGVERVPGAALRVARAVDPQRVHRTGGELTRRDVPGALVLLHAVHVALARHPVEIVRVEQHESHARRVLAPHAQLAARRRRVHAEARESGCGGHES